MELLQSTAVACPYCGEVQYVDLDTSVDYQEYIEDCQICCRPIVFTVQVDQDNTASVTVRDENDA